MGVGPRGLHELELRVHRDRGQKLLARLRVEGTVRHVLPEREVLGEKDEGVPPHVHRQPESAVTGAIGCVAHKEACLEREEA